MTYVNAQQLGRTLTEGERCSADGAVWDGASRGDGSGAEHPYTVGTSGSPSVSESVLITALERIASVPDTWQAHIANDALSRLAAAITIGEAT